jgi:hypothetical protein
VNPVVFLVVVGVVVVVSGEHIGSGFSSIAK